MSGILGVWNLDGRPVEPGRLAQMSATLSHRGPDGEGQWLDGPVGLACQLMRVTPESRHETQPLVHPGGTVIVFDGRLDNREELLDLLKAYPWIEVASPDPVLILAAYEAWGDRFPERLNGDFALALFDPRRKQLLLARDAVGLRTLYYYRTGDLFLFASEIKAIVAHPRVVRRPNDDIVAEFLTHNCFYNNNPGETFFKDIYAIAPGQLALVKPHSFTTRQFWDFDPSRILRLNSFQDYAEAFRHLFAQAVGRRLRSAYPVAVLLSGGLDSSSIFCQAERLRQGSPDHNPAILGISYAASDGSPADEQTFLRDIERLYGSEIVRIPMGLLGFSENPQKEVWQVEGPLLEWNIVHQAHRRAHGLGARVLITGFWGDEVLSDMAYLTDLFRKLAWAEIKAHLQEVKRWMTDVDPTIFKKQFVKDLIKHHLPEKVGQWLKTLRARFYSGRMGARVPSWYTQGLRKRALARLSRQTLRDGRFASVHAKMLYREIKFFYNLIYLEWYNKLAAANGLDLAFPFMDRDLMAFLIQTPGEKAAYRGVPKAILREAVRGVLPETIRLRRWKGDVMVQFEAGMDKDLPGLLHQVLSQRLGARFGYLKDNGLAEELTRGKERLPGNFFHGSRNFYYLWGMELWLQTFFGQNLAGGEDTINQELEIIQKPY